MDPEAETWASDNCSSRRHSSVVVMPQSRRSTDSAGLGSQHRRFGLSSDPPRTQPYWMLSASTRRSTRPPLSLPTPHRSPLNLCRLVHRVWSAAWRPVRSLTTRLDISVRSETIVSRMASASLDTAARSCRAPVMQPYRQVPGRIQLYWWDTLHVLAVFSYRSKCINDDEHQLHHSDYHD